MLAVLQTFTASALAGQVVVYAAALIGVGYHYSTVVPAPARTFRGFWRHLLPPGLLVSPWTRLDITYYFVNRVLLAAVFPSVAGLVALTAAVTKAFLLTIGGSPAVSLGPGIEAIFLVLILLARDLISFATHALQHSIPILWEFHKVHHAPQTLIPPTGHRLHPLDELPGTALEAFGIGLLAGIFSWVTAQSEKELLLYSVGIYAIINTLTLAPLRHSHIDLYVPKLDAILLSPAHHRLHHSVERPHWDKNFAAIFSFWDRLFGTYHSPPPAESYRLGLPAGASAAYDSLWRCYATPIRSVWQISSAGGFGALWRPRPLARDETARRATGEDRSSAASVVVTRVVQE